MSYTDPSDAAYTTLFAGTPIGGSPHWFAHGTNHHTARNVALGAAASAVLGGALAYHQTGDQQKAIQAAKLNLACYFALGPFVLLFGFASFFCLLALVAGDIGFAAVLFLLAILALISFLAVVRHFSRRLGRVVQQPLPPSVP
jgi:hypothetical protein